MKLNEPIPSLEKFKDSKAGQWTRRHADLHTGPQSGWDARYLLFVTLMPVAIALFVVNGLWRYVFFGLGLLTFVSSSILVMAAQERPTTVSRLNAEELAVAKEKFTRKVKSGK